VRRFDEADRGVVVDVEPSFVGDVWCGAVQGCSAAFPVVTVTADGNKHEAVALVAEVRDLASEAVSG
jgi:hypothetical protein